MLAEPYTTLDGSCVKELVRPETGGSRNLSLAEATIAPGNSTLPHCHTTSEEIYYVLAGSGLLHLGGRSVELRPGMAALISPGQEHWVSCLSDEPLRILCACSPPYRHEDTVLTGRVVV